jgi:hypothetical protein
MRFCSLFFTFFGIIQFQKRPRFRISEFCKNKSYLILLHNRIFENTAYKRTVSLRLFEENATFHSAYALKMRDSSSLNTLYTAEGAQFYSIFTPNNN